METLERLSQELVSIKERLRGLIAGAAVDLSAREVALAALRIDLSGLLFELEIAGSRRVGFDDGPG